MTLSVSGFNPRCFAENVDRLFGTEWANCSWPVHLVAHDVEAFRVVTCAAGGQLKTVLHPERGAAGRFGTDFGWQIGGRVAWVWSGYEMGWGLVDCARLTARDESRHRIADVYGPTLGRMFEEMLGLRKTPVPLLEHRGFWVEDPERYVRARAKTLGLSLEQIAEEIWERKRVRG